MQLMKLLHKTLEKELPFVHKTRFKNLMSVSTTLIKSNKLTLTALGRNLSKRVKTRSNIKKVDRLLGNSQLHQESVEFYRVMSRYLIPKDSQPWIHVDWSCICAITKLYMLRASVSMQGRSVVIYEECHPKKRENNHVTHKLFLKNLKTILPNSVKPIIVTDAGFRAPWFKYIIYLGWDFVGRLRNKNAVLLDSKSEWQLSKSFYASATGTPVSLGIGLLTEKQRVPANFILYKDKRKNRHKLTLKKKRSNSSKSKKYAKAHKEPWVLVSSIDPSTQNNAVKIVNIYRQRMRIEENFRDTKCTRYGFGLKESRSRSTERMKILLLIAAIATFACWIGGIVTQAKGNAAEFQAHSAKFISALSIVYLGRESLKKGLILGVRQFENALSSLFDINAAAQLETPHYG